MNDVELTDVSKSFGSFVAVRNLSLAVPAGSIYGFIGPNGSGKTTTLRMILRIYKPNSGTVRVLGEERHDAVDDRIAYLPEERSLYKKMTVRDVITFFAELKGMRNSRPLIDEWLERFRLSEWATKKVEALSKGMSQRVQLIATIIAKPKILVLDEPFSGLDPVNATVVRETVLELNKNGSTIIFSTHDMSVAEQLCDYIFMIYRGNKVLDGSLERIQEEYGDDTIRLEFESGTSSFDISARLAGVEQINDFGNVFELRLKRGVDTQRLLAELMSHGRIKRFEKTKPSLHDIFVRIASPEPETEHAA